MRTRWTAPAAKDLYGITRHIQRDNPSAAREVAKAIYDGCENLATFPRAKAASQCLSFTQTRREAR
jgi:plasmid stabilization system protein ParE